MDDEIPDLPDSFIIAEALAQHARGIRGYYVSLVDEGFSKDEAMALTISYQSSLLANIALLSRT